VALAHDWLVGLRGGERVLDAIARLCTDRFEIAGVFTMFDNGRPHTPAIDALPRFVSRLGRLPGATTLRRWLLPQYPSAVEDLSRQLAAEHARRPIDLLISTSSAAIKGLCPPPGVAHVCYCHTPARYLWSQAEQYTRGGIAGRLRAIGFRLYGNRLRDWDRRTAAHVTAFVANSTHTAREIARVYGREAEVVHPPVRTGFFVPESPRRRGRHWLCVGALEPYKRTDLAVAAAARCTDSLVIVGDGSERSRLRRASGPGVTFDSHATDALLRVRFQRASVLVFPQIEDFGIVAVEAQACGTPVAAFRAGGALDTVIESVTGVFFDEPTPEALFMAVQKCLALGDVSRACRANAERFAPERFDAAMLGVIDRAMSGGSARP
jgi:glycosyltransferase involved in cell wall biosynthesis